MQSPLDALGSETTRKQNYQGLIFGTTRYHGIGCDDMHFHENPTICFLLDGGAIERRNGTSYERYAGDARFYHAAELHQSAMQAFPSQCINLEFEAEYLERYSISENMIDKAVLNRVDVRFAMLKMYQESNAGDALAASSIEMLLFELLDTQTNGRKMPGWLPALGDLLRDRWAENPSLDELSVAAGAHPVTISKYFRRYFRCTLGEYMRKLKVEHSLSLIKKSQLSLTDVALQCGFSDQSHFTRCFKKTTGFLPKEFRNL
jgi:AraC family transcriptional regulator